MFSYDGKKRPTIEDVKNHPWMKKPFSTKITKQNICEKLQEKRYEKTTDTNTKEDNSRGDSMLELVREYDSNLETYKFNDMADHDIQVSPGAIWEDLNKYNVDFFGSKL